MNQGNVSRKVENPKPFVGTEKDSGLKVYVSELQFVFWT